MGLQSTLVVTKADACVNFGRNDNQQIINQPERQHWVAYELKDRELYVYDSLQPKQATQQITKTTKEVFKMIFSHDIKYYIRTDSSQQCGSHDCGVFAIANVTAICQGESPVKIRYRQGQMRQHLIRCFENGLLVPFPSTQKRNVQASQKCAIP